MDIGDGIKQIISKNKVQLYGFANLQNIEFVLRKEQRDFFQGYVSGISLGVPSLYTLVESLKYHHDKGLLKTYENHLLNQINELLERTSMEISYYLEAKNFKAFTIPAKDRFYLDPPFALLSHKMIANLAGIGWIGRSSIVVNPDYGPSVRLISILTDTPLEYTSSIKPQCNKCRLCVDACPVDAIYGQDFEWDNPAKVLQDAEKCENYRAQRNTALGSRICNLCVYACPIGKKN